MDLFEDNLNTSVWLGEVTNNTDELFEGRIKVKVWGKFDELEDEDLPWALPGNLITAGSETGSGFHNVPKVGSIVRVTFDNGDIYQPTWHNFKKISNELKTRIGTEELYANANSLVYDTESNMYIYFIPTEGFFIRTQSDDENATEILVKSDREISLKNFTESEQTNFLKISPDDSFTVSTKDNTNIINIDAEDNVNISNLTNENSITIDNENNITVKNNSTGDSNSIEILADSSIITTSSSGSVVEVRSDGSVFMTSSDGIVVHTNNGVSLGSENSSAEPAVLGDTLEKVLKKFVTEMGKIGLIPTPVGPSGNLNAAGTWAIFKTAVEAEFPKFKSTTVTLD